MPRTRLIKEKENTSKAEVASELTSKLPSDERGCVEVVENRW